MAVERRRKPTVEHIPLPSKIDLMVPIPTSQIPKDPENWLSEIKWNGIRTLVFIEKGTKSYRLRTRHGLDVSDHFPELDKGCHFLSRYHSAVLDSELIYGSGRTAQELIMVTSRINSSVEKSRVLRELLQCKLVAFDLVFLDGKDLRNLSLNSRKIMLVRLLTDKIRENFDLTPNYYEQEDHLALIETARSQGFEGVVFKRKNSFYLGGRRSDWQKMKFKP